MARLPGYAAMLHAISNHQVGAVVAADLHHFGRNALEQVSLVHLCQENGVEIWEAQRGERLLAGGLLLGPADAPRGRLGSPPRLPIQPK